MSKSRPESIIDPLDVISKYGTDALRMALIMGVSPGNDQNWGWSKVEANRNFCNKLWNIARYTEGILGNAYIPGSTPEPQTAADHWVLHKLQQSTEMLGSLLDNYRFSEAYDLVYHFVWDDVADWYIEASKHQESREVLGYVLECVLKLVHPFAPFVTETIWQTLYTDSDSLLISSAWPSVQGGSKKQAADFEELRTIITETRSLIRTLGLVKPNLYYTDVPFLADHAELITRMTGLGAVTEVDDGTGLLLATTKYHCWLDVDSGMLRAYADKVTEQITAQEKLITQLEARLANKSYVDNAPKAVVEQTKDQLKAARQALERLETEKTRFQAA